MRDLPMILNKMRFIGGPLQGSFQTWPSAPPVMRLPLAFLPSPFNSFLDTLPMPARVQYHAYHLLGQSSKDGAYLYLYAGPTRDV